MVHHKGFSLIECLVYVLIVGLLANMLFMWVVRIQQTVYQQAKDQTVTVGIYSAQDLMARDLSMAPSAMSDWKVMSGTQLIWHGPTIDTGWALEDGKLYRYEGHYSLENHSWSARAKSLVSDQIATCNFALVKQEKEKRIMAVTIVLNNIVRYVALKNGMIT